jgi:stringent starvation protein B
MQVLQITIANDIKNFIKDGSQVKMFIPMEKVDAIFHSEDDLPVVLVNEKQYKGMLEIIDTPISDFIQMETTLHQNSALIKAEQEASKQDYESEGISPFLKAND